MPDWHHRFKQAILGSTTGGAVLGRNAFPLFVAVLLSIVVVHTYPYDNVVTRWALTRRLCDSGVLDIDRYGFLTNDKASAGGRCYCDKAVLLSIAAVPICLASSALGAGEPDEPEGILVDPARFVSEKLLVGGCFLLLLLALGSMTGGRILPTLALGLGSILLPYSSLFYSHVPAAALLFTSFTLQTRGRYAPADITGALACALEFPVIVPFAVLLLYRRRASWSPASAARLTALMVLAFIPQLAHNWLAFGGPFRMGYSLESSTAFEGMTNGLFGFEAPNLRSLEMLTVSPERGLFFYMPWAAAGLAGFFTGRSFRETLRSDPGPLLVCIYVVLFSAYYMPSGGWAFGPRHLIPIIPFLALGLDRFASAGPKRAFCAWLLVLPGILQALVGLLGEVHQPVHPVEQPVPLPQWNIGIRMMLDGHHSIWLAGAAGTCVLAASALLSWLIAGRKGMKPSPAGFVPIVLWAGLLLLVDTGWGGRIDYYRGALAGHRSEFGLAAGYYSAAARDPSAPPVVRELADWCTALAEEAPGND
ncbi:MAG TPA: hypothetical protein PLV86_00090 [Candidatus Fermentibacter daniensis]|nr:hypothetical protein [Candidatus Fermentibacter daniensis]HOG55646.1 hypothetical protein [Candidatus Fermentibacter daniensis]HQM40147.1 hypothetical protein [Candidatus Fermentibacter daniensis]